MKVCILGTRGIPNNYGGFEECAQNVSRWLVTKGHSVTVYNPDYHPFNESKWEGVKIKKIFSKENFIGSIGNLIFELLSIIHATRQDFDIILELGTQYALFPSLVKRRGKKIITNVDGLETRRNKWSSIAKFLIQKSEKGAIQLSDAIVSDSPEIKKIVDAVYGISSYYIGYGSKIRDHQSDTDREMGVLESYGVSQLNYCIVIARLEPENNLEMIIEGYLKSSLQLPLLIVGPVKNKYAKELSDNFKNNKLIKFIGGIYGDPGALDALRHHSYFYFHGHSVGGTNPALLQAMGQGCMIMAHDNVFNRYVLSDNAHFFDSSETLSKHILTTNYNKRNTFSKNNYRRLESEFSWDKVSEKYLELFEVVLK